MSQPDLQLQPLSEEQMRRLYDDEEVERFMSFFSAYVTEVRLSSRDSTESHVDGLDIATGRPLAPPLPRRPSDRSLSEHIAYDYLLPHLPPAAGTIPAFTLKRLSLTIQRLYLALFPPYQVFVLNLVRLALWKDCRRSFSRCIIFWFLWFHDLILPALVLRIVFGLLRRRLSTHPTLKELQERRLETARALKFGEAVQRRLSVATVGPIELWRIFKLYKSEEKFQLESATEADEEETLKRDMLQALNELADLHERIKNIFAWRRPDVSRRYLLLLIIVAFGTIVLPSRYVAKLVCWFGGVLFWHVTPIIAALPRDSTRVSLLFGDAPTDADCAMDVIAKRIAGEQEVGIRNQSTFNAFASTNCNLARTSNVGSREVQSFEDDGINWKKWGERVARGKMFLEEGRQKLSTHASRNPISGENPVVCCAGAEDVHTFLAQYATSPGLITLTPSTLFFTSLTRTHARLVVPRGRLRGVKRTGLMKGISIAWVPEGLIGEGEREERFHWVGNRDELFARLVGSGGERWLTV